MRTKPEPIKPVARKVREPMASSLSIKSLFLILPPLLFSPGCLPVDEEIEGDEAGECSDGVDNDQDGLLDCDDEGCAIATACAGDDDDDSAADDDSGNNDDSTDETYLVTASSTEGGEISPEGSTAVGSGESLSFILIPVPGMEPSAVEGTCGGTLDGLSFTTDPVVADCTVNASFHGEDVGPAPYCSDIPPRGRKLGQLRSGSESRRLVRRRVFRNQRNHDSERSNTVPPLHSHCGGVSWLRRNHKQHARARRNRTELARMVLG